MNTLSRLLKHLFAANTRQDFIDAQRRVLEYARFLESAAPLPGQVADAATLPYPKAELKTALLLCLGSSDDPVLQEHLEAGYLMLSAFQDGVGHVAVGEDYAGLDLDDDPEATAAALRRAHRRALPWRDRARGELLRLQRELEELNLALGEFSH